MKCPKCDSIQITSLGACNCDGDIKYHDFMCEKEHFWTLVIDKKTGETTIEVVSKK